VKPVGVSVDSFLSEAAGSGSFDSQGVFTVAGEAAIGKLSFFLLPRKSAWVLKVVQCAVAWGAATIEAKQTAEATHIGFASAGTFDIEGLQKALLEVNHRADRYLEHLACGLRAVGFGDKRPFCVKVYHQEILDTYRWDGRELFRERSSIANVAFCTVHLTVHFPTQDKGRWLGGLARSAGRASEEYLELVNCGEACPVPLKVDGRRLDTLTAPRRKSDASVADLCVSWRSRAPEPVGPQLRLPEGVRLEGYRVPLRDRFTDPGPLLVDGELDLPEGPALIRLRYYYKILSHRSKNSSFRFEGRPEFSKVHWVCDGVVCQSQKLRWEASPVALDLYLSAEGMATDLSGLTFRDTSRQQQVDRLREGLANLRPCSERLIATLESHVALPWGVHTAFYGGFGLLLGVMVPGAGKVVGLGVMGASLAISAADKRSVIDHCLGYVRKLEALARDHEPP
jgi:hypothetical protein